MTTASDAATGRPSAAAVRAMALAAHEAGHAVAAHALGWEVGMLSFLDDGTPYLPFRPTDRLGAAQRWKLTAIVMLAGGLAEAHLAGPLGLPPSPAAVRDQEEVQALAARRFPAHPPKQAAYLAQAERAAADLLRKPRHRRALQALVQAILRGEPLSAAQTLAVIAAAAPDPARRQQ